MDTHGCKPHTPVVLTMTTPTEMFGDELKRLRGGRSRQWVADRMAERGVQVTYQAVGKWENGTEPSREKIATLEEVFELNPGDLTRFFGYVPIDYVPPAVTPDETEERLERIEEALNRLLQEREDERRSARSGESEHP